MAKDADTSDDDKSKGGMMKMVIAGVAMLGVGAGGGFGYSEVLATLEGDWTPEALSGFLEDPRGYANGTKMSYAGMDDVEDRANLIAYLQTFGGS